MKRRPHAVLARRDRGTIRAVACDLTDVHGHVVHDLIA